MALFSTSKMKYHSKYNKKEKREIQMCGQSVERGGVFKVAGIDKWVHSLSLKMIDVIKESVASGKLLK